MQQEKNSHLNLVLQRLVEFIDSKGGFSEVGRKIGRAPQMFSNLIRRDAKPSLDTLEEIATVYPDFDLNYIVRGERSVGFDVWSTIQQENVILKREKEIFLNAMDKMGKFRPSEMLLPVGHVSRGRWMPGLRR